ncbi:MAG: amidohydrolase family protein [Marmoricola sp.]
MSVLFRDAEVCGEVLDVAVVGSVITSVGPRQSRVRAGLEIDAHGGALLPGLHDHHLHLLAMAAALASVDCAELGGAEGLASALRGASGTWVRAVGYHESLAGPLDRYRLDALVDDRPVRVQHASGSLWILNSAALRAVEHALDDTTDVERDRDGTPTGRLWRYDERLRRAIPGQEPSLGPVGAILSALGITGVTDATPDLDAEALALLARARASGGLPQRLTLLGAPVDAVLHAGISHGPRKIMIRDHDLPRFDDLVDLISSAREGVRPVAVHCVSADSLALTIAALSRVGPVRGDRIEHAAVVPPALVGELVDLGVAIVTQPDLLRTRGERYLAEVSRDEIPWLYPYCSLEAAGLHVAASSDAPYGASDPWAVIRSARDRVTGKGRVLGRHEQVGTARALRGYLTVADEPGGRVREVRAGRPADLCLLRRPLADVLQEPCAADVRVTVVAGDVVHHLG